jgi:hypothetical protein
MHSNHPIDPLDAARAIVLATYERDLAAEPDLARVVQTVRTCVSRYGDAFPVVARVRALQQRIR